MTTQELQQKALKLRRGIVEMAYKSGESHIGGALSSSDVIAALFYEVMRVGPHLTDDPERDRFLLSKGHCVEGYLCALADLGFFPEEELGTFCAFGTRLIGHPNRAVPGVEMNTGSLGHGLPLGCGMALDAKRTGRGYRTWVLMGDGELNEGSIWEAGMFAAHYKLDNLCAIVDRNRLQISGATEEVMGLEPLADKWRAFGFEVCEVDGHDMARLVETFRALQNGNGRPKLVLANTVKGKGVAFMENQAGWHHGAPNEDEYHEALRQLDEAAKGGSA